MCLFCTVWDCNGEFRHLENARTLVGCDFPLVIFIFGGNSGCKSVFVWRKVLILQLGIIGNGIKLGPFALVVASVYDPVLGISSLGGSIVIGCGYGIAFEPAFLACLKHHPGGFRGGWC